MTLHMKINTEKMRNRNARSWFYPCLHLFHDGQSVRISNPLAKYSGGGGISIKFSKMVFLYKCGSNFTEFTLNGLNSGQVQKSFCPGPARILIYHRPELGFLTIFSQNMEWVRRLSPGNICVICGSYQTGRGAVIRVIRTRDNYEISSAPITQVFTDLWAAFTQF